MKTLFLCITLVTASAFAQLPPKPKRQLTDEEIENQLRQVEKQKTAATASMKALINALDKNEEHSKFTTLYRQAFSCCKTSMNYIWIEHQPVLHAQTMVELARAQFLKAAKLAVQNNFIIPCSTKDEQRIELALKNYQDAYNNAQLNAAEIEEAEEFWRLK